jgi:hypothetical protein
LKLGRKGGVSEFPSLTPAVSPRKGSLATIREALEAALHSLKNVEASLMNVKTG